ncbi:MAG: SPFH domain-containing protein [Myxococcales bacterium FL481]|nr:MAG: SPFH domain-containing protein [Myxococcales bacterium FL481]
MRSTIVTNPNRLRGVARLSAGYLAFVLIAFGFRACFLDRVNVGETGVRFSALSGVYAEDLEPGYHYEIPGLHQIYSLPSRYLFLNYAGGDALTVRTKDNNTVQVDVSIPYRIVQGQAWEIAEDGNHVLVGDGVYRFERFAKRAADDVLLAELAKLSSVHFYNTEKRLGVAGNALRQLNEELAQYHLEADSVLIRQAYFRKEYEQQLAQIQLNEQTKLLDAAKGDVAKEQQRLDNYNQGTAARVAAKEQDWARRIADLERAYMVGSIDVGEDQTPGAARRGLVALGNEERNALVAAAAQTLGVDSDDITDAHLLGIKNVQAETIEYKDRVYAEADGVAARLAAQGDAKVAEVQGAYERRINELLNSPGGRAYVAYNAAANISFADTLTFQSRDGVPVVYRLREFARQFMGQ